MKNLQKLALGLMVAVMAIGFSAFTNAPSKAKFATRYWINDGTGNYVLFSGTPDPATHCINTAPVSCAVESTNPSIPASFPNTNPSHYPITPVSGSKLALYQ